MNDVFPRRSLAATVVAVLICAAFSALAVSAAAQTVQLRIEGESSTIFEDTVQGEVRNLASGTGVDGGDGSGPQDCDGTNGGVNPAPGITPTGVMDTASTGGAFTWLGEWNSGFEDFFVRRIGPDDTPGDFSKSWGVFVNFKGLQTGGCQHLLQAGDRVLFAFGPFGDPLLRLDGPSQVETGETFALRVTDGESGDPIANATVGGRSTDAQGRASFSYSTPGTRTFKARKPDTVRSNSHSVRVVEAVEGHQAPTSGEELPALPPTLAVLGEELRDGRVFGRRGGPSRIEGTVEPHPRGIERLELRITRALRSCQTFDPSSRRLSASRCGAGSGTWFEVPPGARHSAFAGGGESGPWSYSLPGRLPRGRYVIDARATDGDGRTDRLLRGRTRSVIYVGVPKIRAGETRNRITSIREQGVYRGRGPRKLEGEVDLATGLRQVRVTLRHQLGRRCSYYSPTEERLRRIRCGAGYSFSVGDRANWSYLLPGALPRGRYVLDAVAIDGEDYQDPLRRGRTRVVFVVR